MYVKEVSVSILKVDSLTVTVDLSFVFSSLRLLPLITRATPSLCMAAFFKLKLTSSASEPVLTILTKICEVSFFDPTTQYKGPNSPSEWSTWRMVSAPMIVIELSLFYINNGCTYDCCSIVGIHGSLGSTKLLRYQNGSCLCTKQ